MKAKHCDECKHMQADESRMVCPGIWVADVIRCAKGHKPRFYMPRTTTRTLTMAGSGDAMTLDRPDWHVVPTNDLREHEANGSCWCKPTLDEGVWLHHSMDGRQLDVF